MRLLQLAMSPILAEAKDVEGPASGPFLGEIVYLCPCHSLMVPLTFCLFLLLFHSTLPTC